MKQVQFYLLVVYLSISSCNISTPEWQKTNMGFNDSFHDIAPLDKNTAIAYSYGTGLIVKTTDKGKTWKKVYQTDSVYLEQIEFPSAKVGFICGNTNIIFKTTDGGDKWTEIIIDSLPNDASIYGMKFIDIYTGYIAVNEWANRRFKTDIYRTTDSGINWIKINTIPEILLNIELINNELWASGLNIVIKNIEKTDWQIVYKDTTRQVGQIREFILSNETIIMAGFNGYIVTKKDSEVTMKRITRNRIRSIVLYDKEKLVATGDNNNEKGNLFESVDHGKTWKLIDQEFNDIHRLKYKDGIIWGVGKNDELIKMKL